MVIRIGPHSATIRGKGSHEPALVEYANAGELEAAVAVQANAFHKQGARDVTILIEEHLLQRRTLDGLPPMSSKLLRELVDRQQSRFFRRTGGPLVTNARWSSAARGVEAVALAVAVEQAWLDGAVAALTQSGLRVKHITDGQGVVPLWPRTHEALLHQKARRVALRLCGVGTMLWGSVLAAHLVRLVTTERRLDRELERLREPAAAVQAIRGRMRNVERSREVLDHTGRRALALRHSLGRILVSLPDSAYLTSLTLDTSGTAVLAGAARDPDMALAVMERESGLAGLRSDGRGRMVDGTMGRRWERLALEAGSASSSDP